MAKIKSIKTPKANKNFHSSNQKTGMGDFNGMGIKPKMGRVIDNYEYSVNPSKSVGKVPKKLA